jgi:hypothetical protein
MYVNLKYENFQDYAQKPPPIFCILFLAPILYFWKISQQYCALMNSASGQKYFSKDDFFLSN